MTVIGSVTANIALNYATFKKDIDNCKSLIDGLKTSMDGLSNTKTPIIINNNTVKNVENLTKNVDTAKKSVDNLGKSISEVNNKSNSNLANNMKKVTEEIKKTKKEASTLDSYISSGNKKGLFNADNLKEVTRQLGDFRSTAIQSIESVSSKTSTWNKGTQEGISLWQSIDKCVEDTVKDIAKAEEAQRKYNEALKQGVTASNVSNNRDLLNQLNYSRASKSGLTSGATLNQLASKEVQDALKAYEKSASASKISTSMAKSNAEFEARTKSLKSSVDKTTTSIKELNTSTSGASTQMNTASRSSSVLSNRIGALGKVTRRVGSAVSLFTTIYLWDFIMNLENSISSTVEAKSEMEQYMATLNWGTGEINYFNKALDKTIQQFQKVNKYSMGETATSLAVEFSLSTAELEEAMPVIAMIQSEYMRAGRTVEEATLAVKDIMQGEFVRLSRETGVGKDELVAAGWSGDNKDIETLLEALNKVGKSRHWDVFAQKATSLTDVIQIAQNRLSEFATDIISVITPNIINGFNLMIDGIDGVRYSFDNLPQWGKNFVSIAGSIGLATTALVAFVSHRTGLKLVEIGQIGLKNATMSAITGIKAESLEANGLRNSLLGLATGLDATIVKENGFLASLIGANTELQKSNGITLTKAQAEAVANGELTKSVALTKNLSKEVSSLKFSQKLAVWSGNMTVAEAKTAGLGKSLKAVITSGKVLKGIGISASLIGISMALAMVQESCQKAKESVDGFNDVLDMGEDYIDKWDSYVKGYSKSVNTLTEEYNSLKAQGKDTTEVLKNLHTAQNNLSMSKRNLADIKTAYPQAQDYKESYDLRLAGIQMAQQQRMERAYKNAGASQQIATEKSMEYTTKVSAGIKVMEQGLKAYEDRLVKGNGVLYTHMQDLKKAGANEQQLTTYAEDYGTELQKNAELWNKWVQGDMWAGVGIILSEFKLLWIDLANDPAMIEFMNNLNKLWSDLSPILTAVWNAVKGLLFQGINLLNIAMQTSEGRISVFIGGLTTLGAVVLGLKGKLGSVVSGLSTFGSAIVSLGKKIGDSGLSDKLKNLGGVISSSGNKDVDNWKNWKGYFEKENNTVKDVNNTLNDLEGNLNTTNTSLKNTTVASKNTNKSSKSFKSAFSGLGASLGSMIAIILEVTAVVAVVIACITALVAEVLLLSKGISELVKWLSFDKDKEQLEANAKGLKALKIVMDNVLGIMADTCGIIVAYAGANLFSLGNVTGTIQNTVNDIKLIAWNVKYLGGMEVVPDYVATRLNMLKSALDYMKDCVDYIKDITSKIGNGFNGGSATVNSAGESPISTAVGYLQKTADALDDIGDDSKFPIIGNNISEKLHNLRIASYNASLCAVNIDKIGSIQNGGTAVASIEVLKSVAEAIAGFGDEKYVLLPAVYHNLYDLQQDTTLLSQTVSKMNANNPNPQAMSNWIGAIGNLQTIVTKINGLSSVTEQGQNSINSIKTAIESIANTLKTQVGAVSTESQNLGKAVKNGIVNGMSGLYRGITTQVANAVKASSDSVYTQGRQIAIKMNKGFKDRLNFRWGVSAELSNLTEWISRNASWITSIGASIGSNITQGYTTKGLERHSPGALYKNTIAEINDVGTAIQSNLGNMYNMGVALGTNLVNGYGNSDNLATGVNINQLQTDTTKATNLITSADATINRVSTGTVKNTEGTFNNLGTNMNKTFTGISSTVNSSYSDINNTTRSQLSTMQSSTTKNIGEIRNSWGEMQDALVGSAEGIRNKVTNKIRGLESNMASFWRKIQNPVLLMASAGSPSMNGQGGRASNSYKRGVTGLMRGRGFAGGLKTRTPRLRFAGGTSNTHVLNKRRASDDEDYLKCMSKSHGNCYAGGWNFDWSPRIISKVKGWRTHFGSMYDDILSVGSFENSTFPVKGNTTIFKRYIQDAIGRTSYAYYFNSAYGDDPIRAYQAGAFNCWDGANIIGAIASAFGLKSELRHGTWNGIGHVWRYVEGVGNVDATAIQGGYGLTAPSRVKYAGSPRGVSAGTKNINNNTNAPNINLTINVEGGDDSAERIANVVQDKLVELLSPNIATGR